MKPDQLWGDQQLSRCPQNGFEVLEMQQIDIEELTGRWSPSQPTDAPPERAVTSNKSSKDLVARFKKRQRAAGLVEITVWVPKAAAADIRPLSQRLCTDIDLGIGPIRRIFTGKLERL